MSTELQIAAERLAERFSQIAQTTIPRYLIGHKAGSPFLEIIVGAGNSIFSAAANQLNEELELEHPFKERVILKEQKPESWIKTAEVELLQATISGHLTIGKDTLTSDFFKKFIPFVGAEEKKIFSKSNSVIFGRRGAGKSSLLLYAANQAQASQKPFAWLNLQQFSRRTDTHVIVHIIWEVFESLRQQGHLRTHETDEAFSRLRILEEVDDMILLDRIRRDIPTFVRLLRMVVEKHDALYILIDDLHVIESALQPKLLSVLYNIARGNGVYLKITAIENLTNLYDGFTHDGIETPGDAQITRLDYNLINPQASYDHIRKIINAYTEYLGIPSVFSLTTQKALVRLIWVSAGVPRDALYMFNNAINRARNGNRAKIGLTDINLAASDLFIEKNKYINVDSGADEGRVSRTIEAIKDFCIKTLRSNAFLVKVEAESSNYKTIRKVSDLRFIHILHTGITPNKAGEKFEAYILDYALYTGFRKSRGMKEFYPGLEQRPAKDFRQLKEFKYANLELSGVP